MTPGSNSACVKSRAASRIIKCSSDRVKFIDYSD
jgi:hypothetical protein